MDVNKQFEKCYLYKKEFIFIFFNSITWFLLFLIPIEHAKMLIVLFFALTGWGMGVFSQPIISFSIIIYISILNLITFKESLLGFGQPFVWLLMSTFILAAAFEKTGLGKRIALHLLLSVKGNIKWSLLFLLLTLVTLGFFIPTAAGRTAMLIPICIGLIQVTKVGKESNNFAKNILLGVAFTSSLMSWAIITGSSSSIYAVSSIHMMTGFQWTYFNWFILNFPITLILVLLLWLILRWKFPIDQKVMVGSLEYISTELRTIGKMKSVEFKILIIGMTTLLGWMTESYHGFSVPMIALTTSIVSCLPLVGVQTWKDASKKVDWDVIILFGAAYTLADALQRNGTAAWIAVMIGNALPSVTPLGAALLMIGIVALFRLGFANMLGITAIFLPISISLAEIWNMNPIWLTQIVIISCSFSYFLPMQSPSNLITFSWGYYTERDLFKTGIIFTFVVIFIVVAFALLYWPLMGLAPK